jgi:hypothetical protein
MPMHLPARHRPAALTPRSCALHSLRLLMCSKLSCPPRPDMLPLCTYGVPFSTPMDGLPRAMTPALSSIASSPSLSSLLPRQPAYSFSSAAPTTFRRSIPSPTPSLRRHGGGPVYRAVVAWCPQAIGLSPPAGLVALRPALLTLALFSGPAVSSLLLLACPCTTCWSSPRSS